MNSWKSDVSVLLIFFNRADRFEQVLNSVKEARPRKLYLYQDGARNETDRNGINACRKLLETINWECEIFTKFQEKNFGCDPSVYYAIKWMFNTEEYGIVLENDVVVNPTFIAFAQEMLERYKNDNRIGMVCAMNHLKIYQDCTDSYFFSMENPIWGWATWKRVVDGWNNDYSFLNDKRNFKLLKNSIMDQSTIKACRKISTVDNYFFEFILWKHKWLNSQLSIIPTKNMTSNIGVGGGISTHYGQSVKLLPKKKQKIMFMKTYEMQFPLKHPNAVVRDYQYEKRVGKIIRPNFFVKCSRGVEKIIRKFLYKIRIIR